ncbi:MAG: serine/threonine protein kinase, partial [Planctomycetes bacterium]|nr:serine/threonine protein kinase [Planctomycetota bacterium]
GGMGVVYKARHQGLQRVVALKMIRNWGLAGAEEQARFRAEAQAIAQLQHPGIVQIFEIGDWQGMPFLSLEFIEGGTLERKLAGQPMAPLEAASLLRRMAEAMAFAHSRGILHRDLKPANIFLTLEGEPKIGDFGLAKRMDAAPGLTQPDTLLGTPCYMAPEQAERKNRDIGPAADVYALGVILYQMLTGRPPFLAESALATLKQVLEQEPVSPSRLQPGVPTDLATICLKCLHKDPNGRYASAKELAGDLERFEQGKPIQARPVGQLEVAWRWCGRNPLPASLAALLAVVVVVGFGLVFWKWREAADALENEKIATLNAETAGKAKEAALDSERNATKNANDASKALEISLDHEKTATTKAKDASLAMRQALKREEEAFGKLEAEDYRFRIRSARRAWEEGDTRLADKMMESINPSLRRWDWDFLRNMHRSSLVASMTPSSTDRPCAVYSPDGQYLAYLAPDKVLFIQHVKTGQRHRRLDGHSGSINCLAFSADGATLAVGDDSKSITLWDWRAHKPSKRVVNALPGKITSLAISKDGKLAFGWIYGYAVRALSEPDKQDDDLLWKAPRSEFANLAFSSDGVYLVTGLLGGKVEFVDLRNPRMPETSKAHDQTCIAVAIDPRDRFLVTGGGDGLVKIWDFQTKARVQTLPGHLGVVTCVAVDPAGNLLAAGSFDHVVRVWKLQDWTEKTVLRGHEHATKTLSFAGNGAAHLASASFDGTVRVWDLDHFDGAIGAHTNYEGYVYFALAANVNTLFIAETKPMRVWSLDLTRADPFAHKTELALDLEDLRTFVQVAASADGLRLAIADARPIDGRLPTRIHVWKRQTRDGKFEKETVIEAPAATLTRLAFHPTESHRLAAADKAGRVWLWHLADRSKHRVFEGFKAEVRALAISPDGRWLAAGGYDVDKAKCIRIWDLAQADADPFAPEPFVTIAAEGEATCLAFSADGEQLAFWAGKATFASAPIQVVEWKTGKSIAILEGHRQLVYDLAFHPTERRLVSAGGDHFLRAWDLATGNETVHWNSRDRLVDDTRVAFTRDGRFAISSGYDTVGVWDGTCHHERLAMRGHRDETTAVAFRPDGKRLLSGSADNALRIWDPHAGLPIADHPLSRLAKHTNTVASVAYHPTEKIVASASFDKTAILRDADSGAQRHALVGHADAVRWITFSSNGDLVATASNDHTCKLWNPRTGTEIRTLKGHTGKVNTVAFHPNGSRLASCSADGTVRLWDSEQSEEKHLLKGHDANVTDVAFSPDGKVLASGDVNGTIILWDASGRELHRFRAHAMALQSLAFHPQQTHVLISVGDDGLIRLWDLRWTLQAVGKPAPAPIQLAALKGHAGAVYGLAISRDGRQLATTGQDRTVRVWDLGFLARPDVSPSVRR